MHHKNELNLAALTTVLLQQLFIDYLMLEDEGSKVNET